MKTNMSAVVLYDKGGIKVVYSSTPMEEYKFIVKRGSKFLTDYAYSHAQYLELLEYYKRQNFAYYFTCNNLERSKYDNE
jgi:hypothetical protein